MFQVHFFWRISCWTPWKRQQLLARKKEELLTFHRSSTVMGTKKGSVLTKLMMNQGKYSFYYAVIILVDRHRWLFPSCVKVGLLIAIRGNISFKSTRFYLFLSNHYSYPCEFRMTSKVRCIFFPSAHDYVCIRSPQSFDY